MVGTAGEQAAAGGQRAWWPGPLLGFDTETTGVDVESDRIVTAALVRRDPSGTAVRTWLIDPGVEIPDAAQAIHKVSTEQARTGGAAPEVALDEIADALLAALRDGVPLVAYNASFDLGILDAELTRHRLPTLAQRLGHPVRPVLDPMLLDRSEDATRTGPRTLGDLLAVYRVARIGDLHTAEVDVLATLDVLTAVLDRYPELIGMGLDALHERQADWQRGWRASAAAGRARRTAERDAAFLRAVGVATALLTTPPVARSWDEPSTLAHLSVGALACHLGDQVSRAAELLAGDVDPALPLLPGVDEHYARAPWVNQTEPDGPDDVLPGAVAEARQGPEALLTRVAADRAVVAALLASGAPEVVAVPWQGWRLRRSDFLLTRMLEVVVHADDLARSVGVATPTFDDGVFDPVSRLLLRLATRRHGQSALVSALSRRERMPATVSAF